MSRNMQSVPLDSLAKLISDKTFGSKDPSRPYVGLEHMQTCSPDLLGQASAIDSVSVNGVFEKDDILFGKLRPNLRKSVLAPFRGYCSTDILILRTSAGFYPGFVARTFHSEGVFARAVQTSIGTKMPRTSWTRLRNLLVYAPSLPEQEALSNVFDQIDEQVRKTEQLVAKLKLVKQGLLHDLLTRGIDDNGELRDPNRHPEQFKDSPLGRIPKVWQETPLERISGLITSGARDWARFYSGSGPLYIRIGNLTREHINLRLADAVHVQPPASGEGQRTQLQAADVLISITADLGIVGCIPDEIGEAYINQHIALVRILPTHANARFVAHHIAGEAVQRSIRRLNDSGAKAGLNLPAVGRILVALPAEPEQTELARRLDMLDQLVRVEQSTAHKLRLLKQALMDDLLTGRVRVTPLLEGGI